MNTISEDNISSDDIAEHLPNVKACHDSVDKVAEDMRIKCNLSSFNNMLVRDHKYKSCEIYFKSFLTVLGNQIQKTCRSNIFIATQEAKIFHGETGEDISVSSHAVSAALGVEVFDVTKSNIKQFEDMFSIWNSEESASPSFPCIVQA